MQDIVEDIRLVAESLSFSYIVTGDNPLEHPSTPGLIHTITSTVDRVNDARLVGWYFGRLALKENDVPPRVTFVPRSGDITTSANMGGVTDDPVSGSRDRTLFDRNVTLDVYCQGIDFEQTEDLMHLVVAAAHISSKVAVRVGEEEWESQTENGADYARLGEKVRLEMMMRIPILREEAGLTEITNETFTAVLVPC